MVGLCMSWVMELDAIRFRRQVVLTNHRPNFLGHGGMMLGAQAGLMQQVLRVAKFLNRDPLDLLLQNAVKRFRKSDDGVPVLVDHAL